MARSATPILTWIFRGVAVVTFLLVCACTWFYPVRGQDAPVHLHWLSMFPSLFADGVLYPRWLADSFSGFGSPAFYFYPPLTYWLASIVQFVGVDTPEALFRATLLAALVLSGVAFYSYVRRLTVSKSDAYFAALMYCVFPYRFTNMYLRNAFSEHAAYIFLPLLLIALHTIRTSPEKRGVFVAFLAAITVAGLLLTNIPVAVIVAYSLPVFVLANKLHRREYRISMLWFIGGCAVGILTASVYLWPANDLTNAIALNNLWVLNGGREALVGYVVIEVFINHAFRTFAVSMLVMFGLAIVLYWLLRKHEGESTDEERPIRWLLAVAIVFQIPYVLAPVASLLPMMTMVQFVWRWFVWLPVAAALMLVSGSSFAKVRNSLAIVSLLCTLAIGASYYRSITKEGSEGEEPHDAPEYLSARIEHPYLQAVGDFTKHEKDPEVVRRGGSVTIANVKREDIGTSFDAIVSSESASLVFHRMYFPTWRLRDEVGAEYPVGSDSIGRVTATIPKGKRHYELHSVRTNSERISAWLSGLGLALVGALGVLTIRVRRREASSP